MAATGNEQDKDIIKIEISDIFENSDDKYIVPIYQRNYAWEKDEIEQLLYDIENVQIDIKGAQSDNNYYLGTLIVNKQKGNNNIYEVIDGQQRLTTLYLLKKYLKSLNSEDAFDKDADKLQFEAREKYRRTFQKDISKINQNDKDDYYAQEIINGFHIIKGYFKIEDKKELDKKECQDESNTENKEEITNNRIKDFEEKLKNVILLRVQVPENIDLNHYFEIMNTRGEQLEPHEILKANILKNLQSKEDKNVAAQIWEYCSDMNSYIQMKFDTDIRKNLFGADWNTFNYSSFDEIKKIIIGKETSDNEGQKVFDSEDFIKNINNKKNNKDELANYLEANPLSYEQIENIKTKIDNDILKQIKLEDKSSLKDVIKYAQDFPKYPQDEKNKKKNSEDGDDDYKKGFESIITFTNFLLQVNAILNEEVSIKNEETDNSKNKETDDIVGYLDDNKFLEIMEKNYKIKDKNISEDERNDLEKEKAKEFIFNLLKYRFLFDKYIIKRDYRTEKNEGEWSLKKIKFSYVNTFRKDENNQDENEPEEENNKQLKLLQATLRITYTSPKTMKWIAYLLKQINEKLEKKERINCDYLIETLENYCRTKIGNNYKKDNAYREMDRIVFSYLDYILYKKGHSLLEDDERKKWKCVYRNSIEHFSPQTDGAFSGKPEILHNFGNLALITVSGNSKFSNMKPEQKKAETNIINQSLKLKIMKKLLELNGDKWTEAKINEHKNDMCNILDKDMKNLQQQ